MVPTIALFMKCIFHTPRSVGSPSEWSARVEPHCAPPRRHPTDQSAPQNPQPCTRFDHSSAETQTSICTPIGRVNEPDQKLARSLLEHSPTLASTRVSPV